MAIRFSNKEIRNLTIYYQFSFVSCKRIFKDMNSRYLISFLTFEKRNTFV